MVNKFANLSEVPQSSLQSEMCDMANRMMVENEAKSKYTGTGDQT